ncbi:MAG: hypothetical protein QG671_3317, partial [Actinomycetota bacterium]|nr:hypothetical protein [Actinomycetota bacterium]
MADDGRLSRFGAVVLGAVAALMAAPAIGWAESPDTDAGGTSARRADASATHTNRSRPHADSPDNALMRRSRGGGAPIQSAAPPRARLAARAADAAVRTDPGTAAEPFRPVPSAHSHASAPPSAWEAGLAWFQHTFNNATPTFGAQLPVIAVTPGHRSQPIVLGGFDGDGDPLSYTVAGAGSAAGTAGGVLAITDGSAVYTPPEAWDGSTPYDDEFLVTVTDVGPDWHLHGLAGLLNLLTFGVLGSPGDTATGALTVRVHGAPGAGPEPSGPDPDPDPPAPEPTPDPPDPGPPTEQPGPPVAEPDPPVAQPDPPVVAPNPAPDPGTPVVVGSFPVSFVNASGTYTNDQVHVMVIGQASPGQWSWVDLNGIAHPIDHTAANAADHLVKNGVNYANMSFSLAGAGGLRIP